MGVQKTSLNKEKIKNILQNEYDITPIEISPINRGTANIFKIVALGKCYILKEFTNKRTEKTVMKEIDIINFLQEENIKVPKYVKTINGSFYTKNEDARILGNLTKALLNYNKLSDENILEEQFSKARLQQGIQELQELKQKLQGMSCSSNSMKNLANKYTEQIIKDIDYKIRICK